MYCEQCDLLRARVLHDDATECLNERHALYLDSGNSWGDEPWRGAAEHAVRRSMQGTGMLAYMFPPTSCPVLLAEVASGLSQAPPHPDTNIVV